MTLLTTKTIKSLATGFTALMLVSTAVIPAQAGGQIQINIASNNPHDGNVIRNGLELYSIVRGMRAGGGITQNGNGNNAGVGQHGSGNHGIIHQQGNGHNGSIRQVGNRNSYGLFQFGKNTNAHVNQQGNGNAGATFAFGW